MKSIPQNKKIVLFDGVCNLCNRSIGYIIKHDKKDVFVFAPLQSEVGQDLITKFNIDTSKTDSVLLYEHLKGISIKSTAALKIFRSLGFPRYLMALFFIIPMFIRDPIYDYIAKNRYKWFGKRDYCMVPSPELNKKFLQ